MVVQGYLENWGRGQKRREGKNRGGGLTTKMSTFKGYQSKGNMKKGWRDVARCVGEKKGNTRPINKNENKKRKEEKGGRKKVVGVYYRGGGAWESSRTKKKKKKKKKNKTTEWGGGTEGAGRIGGGGGGKIWRNAPSSDPLV